MPKELLDQCLIEAIQNSLIMMAVHVTTPNLDVLCEHLIDHTHELTLRVNLEQFGPPQRLPSVDAAHGIGNLFSFFCGQGLSGLEPADDVDHSEGILVCFTSDLIMRQKQQVSFVDLVQCCCVEFWLWNVPWSREVDLPKCLILQPTSGHIFGDLNSFSHFLDGGEPLPVDLGAIV